MDTIRHSVWRRLLRCERGAVMMEAIIVMPLYIVLIGGVMWVGELSLAKQQLVIADRYAAWNMGNRHRNIRFANPVKGEINDIFFPDAVHPDQRARVRPVRAANDRRWWYQSGAMVPLRMKMPTWTKGWFSSTSKVFFKERTDERVRLKGRDIRGKEHHVVIMRSKRSRDPDYPRNWKGDLLAGSRKPWKRNVYKEPWPMARRKAKRPPLVKKPDTYERWDDFETWST